QHLIHIMIEQSGNRSLKKKRNVKLSLNSTSSPLVSQQSLNGPQEDGLTQSLKDLQIGLEFRLDLKAEDLMPLKEVGAGNGGTVTQVMHITTKTVMAKKIIHIDVNPTVRKQIQRELQVLHDCNSRYIVSFYGAFTSDSGISMCMEYMDVGSLDNIYKKNGPILLDIIGKITIAVLEGLNYLYESHRIIHRDVKPSNILVNSKGQIKICDFGVSGKLINSIADTFVGTSNYMSPERIQGASYSVRSDVWSVGITLMELAMGRFPFPPDGSQLTVLELLQHIVHEPAPKLPQDQFPEDFSDFINQCLLKDVKIRPAPNDLLKHRYVKASAEANVDVEAWAKTMVDEIVGLFILRIEKPICLFVDRNAFFYENAL
ncbi:13736_t:CDS:2, partial [Dentiscutata heterogama]